MKSFFTESISFSRASGAANELSGEGTKGTSASLRWMGDPQKKSTRACPDHAVPRAAGALPPLACGLLLLALAGCANTGAPKAPSLRLPRPATHLAADRTGDTVTLHWETPAETTDGGTYRGVITAQVCRAALPSTGGPACQPVLRMPVQPGASEAVIPLPPSLLTGSPILLAYQVDLLNDHNRSAGPSAPVYAASGAAPPAAGALAASPRRNGLLLTWQARKAPGSVVELHRTLPGAAGKTAAKPTAGKLAGGREAASGADVVLRPETSAQSQEDPGGLIDRTLRDGDVPTYTAQRVRSVQLLVPSAQAAATAKKAAKPHDLKPALQSFEIRGLPSPPLTIAFHDTIPAAPPTGLAAIASAPGATPSIDLSWDPAPEQDVTGYNVYRADAASEHFVRLNQAPASGPGYRDLTAVSGHAYSYRVTAVDVRGNESAPTAPLRSDDLR